MARTVRPTNVVPIPESKKRPSGMWGRLLSAARALPRRERAGPPSRRLNPFTPALPMPGVVGRDDNGNQLKPNIPQIAQDAAEAFKLATDDWVGGPGSGWMGGYAGGYFASAYAEGQEWLGYAVLAILSQRPEYRIAVDTYATEMTREWIDFKSKSEDHDKQPKIDELVTRLTELQLKSVVKAAIENDGFQGRGQIYIDTGDGDDSDELKTPIGKGGDDTRAKFGRDGLAHDFSPGEDPGPEEASERRGKKRIKRLAAIEPMWCYPSQYDASDPLRPDWYRPEFWWVMGKEVHRTRLLTFVSNPVPDMLKAAYSFGGLSLIQMGKPYVDFWLRNRTSSSDLLSNFSVPVLSTELDVVAMDEGSELLQRVQTFNVLRDNQSTMVINKDSEEFNIAAAPLGGVKDLVGQSAEHITVPFRIPIVKYFGNQPSGLNADSEGVIRLFYDRIHAGQEGTLREPIQTIVNMVEIELWGEVDDDIEFEFVSLWQLDEAGKAAIQKTKADQRAVDIEAGIITPEEGRLAAARDADSQYSGLDLHKPLPEPDPMELLAPEGEESGEPGMSQARGMSSPEDPGEIGKPSRRDFASGITNAGAKFGAPATGGFKNMDERVPALTASDFDYQ